MVTYSNFALAMTTTRTVTKLDDDHLAIGDAVARVVAELRRTGGAGDDMLSFSGINLIADPKGGLGIPRQDPLSGSGDIGFFDVTEKTVFTHDRRFERVPRPAGQRRFSGFLYWHLKYLKTGLGFANYDLEDEQGQPLRPPQGTAGDAARRAEPGGTPPEPAAGPHDEDGGARRTRRSASRSTARGRWPPTFPTTSLEAALRRTVAAEFLEGIV